MTNSPNSNHLEAIAAVVAAPGVGPRNCLDCGYRLDNITSLQCPECGRAFDPADRWTTSVSGRIGRLDRWVAGRGAGTSTRGIRRASLLGALVAILVSVCRLGDRWSAILWLCVAYVVVGTAYMARQTARRRSIRLHGFPIDPPAADRRVVANCRRIFLVAAGLIMARVPFYVVFALSLPFLHRVAVYEYEVRPVFEPRPEYTMVGLFPIRRVEVGFGGTTFQLPFGGRLLFRPEGETFYHTLPEHPTVYRLHRHLFGPWYVNEQEFGDWMDLFFGRPH